jgi:hypothetical protein
MMKGTARPAKQISRLVLQRTSSGPSKSLLLPSWSRAAAGGGRPSASTPLQSFMLRRSMSAVPAANASASSPVEAAGASATNDAAAKDKTPATPLPPGGGPGADTGNVFLDNLGSIFLSSIGLIVASLVRSYYGTNNRNKIRDALEAAAPLDPLEIDDLRTANSELTVQVFRSIMKDVTERFPDHESVTYGDFIAAVRRTMVAMKGDNFTIELGHLMDRVVLGALKRHGHTSDEPQTLTFWLTALSLALSTPAVERIQMLYEVLQEVGNIDAENKTVTVADVQAMVGYLQDTCQLVPDTQVIMVVERKYPVQQYACGAPKQLVNWEGSEEDPIDVDAFAEILRSKSVCAWGECYSVKRHV